MKETQINPNTKERVEFVDHILEAIREFLISAETFNVCIDHDHEQMINSNDGSVGYGRLLSTEINLTARKDFQG